MNPSLLRVMYAPLDYIHAEHFPSPRGSLPSTLQQAVNHTLIQRFSLPTKLDFSLTPSDFSQQLVENWKFLSHAAWLLGCRLARGSLAMGGHLAALPVIARRFIELPVPCPACPLNLPLTQPNLEMHGARYLFLLQPQLPDALAQRLALVFAPHEQGAHQGHALNRSLLTFAFDFASDYAKNTSH
jgi:type III secretion system OrgA/MxiK family protein